MSPLPLSRPMRERACTTGGVRGMMLIEALLGILIFSVGILGLVGLQAASMRNATEARYRTEAAYLANQIVGRMWIDRGVANANLANYVLTTATTCTSSAATALQQWLCEVERTLPGITATVARPTITVATDTVTVTMRWRAATNSAITDGSDIRRYVLIAKIN
jgi:type IV pilus assembly protein PilV